MSRDEDAGPIGTLTRHELESKRGWLANGNGAADLVAHHDAPSPTLPQDHLEPTGMGDPSSERPAHSCRGCGASLEGRAPSTVWCNQACRNRHRDRQRDLSGTNVPDTGDRRAKSGTNVPELMSSRESKPLAPTSALGLFDLAGLLAASIPQGVSFSLELGGVVTISASRE
jgi:hypothetical protein